MLSTVVTGTKAVPASRDLLLFLGGGVVSGGVCVVGGE